MSNTALEQTESVIRPDEPVRTGEADRDFQKAKMISGIFNTLFYQPLYNGLIFLMNLIPWADAGVVVVIFTLIVKFILFPLSKKAILTQQKIKKFEPELKNIKEKFTDRQEQARKMFEFYKEKKINPFSSFFLIFLQLPIILALYRVFWSSGLPEIKQDILYFFVGAPEHVNMVFLGLVDITSKNWVLAVLVGVTSFIQMKLSMPAVNFKEEKKTFKEDLARSMNVQMKYIFPILAIFISYSISGAIALYWLTSNLFAIGQEIIVKKRFLKETAQNQK